ncbi:hypothetical protein DICVIV_04570 [Dictyocaulus viviparus]|uniref:Uncharacterized protein n=1 Tax=Dictyocaulus viviparus TaxID=29172 RepID=A0A0D8Y419_DICVI|nr:hypothetical protein DICVIV_04570 [Dictyocaulus viviparus]
MTFFFGCWCCFCCGCLVCKWLIDCPNISCNLINSISYKFISLHPSIRRRFQKEDDEDIIIDDVVVAAKGIISQHRTELQPTDLRAYENPIPLDNFVEPEAISNKHPQLKYPPNRYRSYSIDVAYK